MFILPSFLEEPTTFHARPVHKKKPQVMGEFDDLLKDDKDIKEMKLDEQILMDEKEKNVK